MTDFYLLMAREGFGVPTADATDRDAIQRLSRGLTKSGPIDLERPLGWTSDRGGPAPDWSWGGFNVPLLSDSFRDVVETHRAVTDEIQWLPASLTYPDGVVEGRWIAHFPGERDILDPVWTEWGPSGLPTVWYLSPAKMAGVTITARPNVSGTIIVSGEIMRALRRAKLTGYRAMRARIADPSPVDRS